MNIVSIKCNIIQVRKNLVTFYKLSKPRLLLVHTSLMSILGHTAFMLGNVRCSTTFMYIILLNCFVRKPKPIVVDHHADM